MKKIKTKKLILPAALVLLIVLLLCGTVYALMFRQTEVVENKFSTAKVSCEVQEVTNEDVSEKTSIKVKNTGNIPAYLRVRIVSYWVQEVEGETKIAAKASSVPEITPGTGWIKASDNTYYYSSPVEADQLTGELLSSKMELAKEDGYLQVVEVFAEAIQSKPGNSVESSWGVKLDGEGNIITAP